MSNWRKGIYSEELSGERAADNMMKEAIGRTIICDDGIPRRVVEIAQSMKWPWKVIINEQDPESKSGYFCNTLSLSAQLIGAPLPDADHLKAFENHCKVNFGIKDDGSFDKPPEMPKSPIHLLR